ncbi:DUF6456 domain-containing protein [Jannaschia sp. LMIT008]|uniref:DUF6456 domain-containing protein n=1 Tax=Jannaschia maritima TaxID=3032585 RepID=UPI0028126791|nr:DUF6456 domain-containing protein [Jannaschia sp. LMIT008]
MLTYLDHTCSGRPLRQVAAARGCAPSTILRQVRRIEARRDDPLIDDAMERFATLFTISSTTEGSHHMSAVPKQYPVVDDDTVAREGRRILRRLCEGDSFLAVGQGMPQAVVLKGETDPRPIAKLPREVAQAFVLQDWVSCFRSGRITRYRITDAGRAALRRLLNEKHDRRVAARGDAASPSPFLQQEADVIPLPVRDAEGGTRTLTVNLAESPLAVLARRRDRGGAPFLSDMLVTAGELLREDFEQAQLGPRIGQNWERFMTAGLDASPAEDGEVPAHDAARDRVGTALAALGPGLGDVALRVCCYLEGLETAEKRMGWAARSGKIVLRIALQRLHQHYTAQNRL